MKGFEITINDHQVIKVASDSFLNIIMEAGTEVTVCQ